MRDKTIWIWYKNLNFRVWKNFGPLTKTKVLRKIIKDIQKSESNLYRRWKTWRKRV